ncbi:alpha/beta hydrolase [Chloroflexi bacterium TSY]|nr:alpha/beta hydrolase [Chloroflexi bacterium TSY]
MTTPKIVHNDPWSRRSWQVFKRSLRWGLILLLAGLALGFCYERYSLYRFARATPESGELVDIGGRSIHLNIQGEGSPTVIFESAFGDTSTIWSEVAPEIAKSTRVVTYDRAGMGWSDFNANSDVHSVASDLRKALDAAGIEGPYIMVGHSLGGIYVREFWHQNRDDVAGMVLVDSSHEEQHATMPQAMKEDSASMRTMIQIAAPAAHFGIPRLECGGKIEGPSNKNYKALMQERNILLGVDNKAPTSGVPLDDLPLIVISAGAFKFLPKDISQAEWRDFWYPLQRDLAARSTNSVHRFVDESGHYIHTERPEVVNEEILRMINAIRSESRIDVNADAASDAND